MSTLAEIEAAVAALPQTEQEALNARLTARLQRKPASKDPAVWLANLEALQKSLALDDEKVRAWKETIRDARR